MKANTKLMKVKFLQELKYNRPSEGIITVKKGAKKEIPSFAANNLIRQGIAEEIK